jgi:hypothetical protein
MTQKTAQTKRPARDKQVSVRISTSAYEATQRRAYAEGRSIADVFNIFAEAYGRGRIALPLPAP